MAAAKKERYFSKGEVAAFMGMTSQALANRATRDEDKGFPQPTYSNESGTVTLYTATDVEKISEFLNRAEVERREKLQAALKGITAPAE